MYKVCTNKQLESKFRHAKEMVNREMSANNKAQKHIALMRCKAITDLIKQRIDDKILTEDLT